MKMPHFLQRLARDQRGATAAEFAMVLPLALLFLFGIIDVGLFAWQFNQSEKATQMGARLAVVTDLVAPGLATQSYVGAVVGGVTLTQGDNIPAGALGLIRCTAGGCQCATAPCPATLGYDGAAFQRVVDRIRLMNPRIAAGNVVVEYRASGLGYAGDPSGLELVPLTTVRLQNLQFTPVTLLLFDGTVPMPSASYSLPAEDVAGTVSN